MVEMVENLALAEFREFRGSGIWNLEGRRIIVSGTFSRSGPKR